MTCEFLTSRDVRRKLFDILFWNHGVNFFKSSIIYILFSCIYLLLLPSLSSLTSHPVSEKFLTYIMSLSHTLFCHCARILFTYCWKWRQTPNFILFTGSCLIYVFVFVSVLWCPTHSVLCFCLVCLHLVLPTMYAASFSGLSIFECPFGIL